MVRACMQGWDAAPVKDRGAVVQLRACCDPAHPQEFNRSPPV